MDLNAVNGGSVGGSVVENSQTYAYIGIPLVFILGFSGSLIPPLLATYFPKYDLLSKIYFKFFSGFASGIVVAVGYVHAIGNGYVAEFQSLTPEYFDANASQSYSLTQTYNWTGFIAMIGSLLTFTIEEAILSRVGGHSHGEPMQQEDINLSKRASTMTASSLADGTNNEDGLLKEHEETKEEHYKLLTDMWVLWLGLSFHSIFVGLALGFSADFSLFSAIVAHQFFEGVGLGARVARARIPHRWQIWLVDFAYAITAPLGTAIGIGINASVSDTGYTFEVANMVIEGIAAGILIYVSLVHMIKGEMDRDDTRRNWKARAALYCGIMLGAGAMSIIGIWA